MKDSEPTAGWENTFGDHPAHAGNFLPDVCPSQRSKGRRIDVAMGEMPEEIASATDAQPAESLRAPFPNPLEKLDRGVQPDGAGGPAGHDELRGRNRSLSQQVLGKPLRIERLQILDRLAEADEPNWQSQLPPQCCDGAAPGTAVKLSNDQARG